MESNVINGMTNDDTPEVEKSNKEIATDLISGEKANPTSVAEKGPVGILSDILTGIPEKQK